jgi:hypothetical protein
MKLDVVRRHPDRTSGGLFDKGKCVDHDIIKTRAVLHSLSNRCGVALERVITQRTEVFMPTVDFSDLSLVPRIRQFDGPIAQARQKRDHPADE